MTQLLAPTRPRNLHRVHGTSIAGHLAAPLGFRAGDANVTRYVGNHPTNGTDPSGLAETKEELVLNINVFLWTYGDVNHESYKEDITKANEIFSQAGIRINVNNVKTMSQEETERALTLPENKFGQNLPPGFAATEPGDRTGVNQAERSVKSPSGTINVHYAPRVLDGLSSQIAGHAYEPGRAVALAVR